MARSPIKNTQHPKRSGLPKSVYRRPAFFAGLGGKNEDWEFPKHFVSIRLHWLFAAAQAGVAAQRTSMLLWYFHGVHERIPRRSFADLAALLPLGLTARTVASGLAALKKAGLITMRLVPGKTSTVTVLDDDELLANLERRFWITERPGTPRALRAAREEWDRDGGGDEWRPPRVRPRMKSQRTINKKGAP